MRILLIILFASCVCQAQNTAKKPSAKDTTVHLVPEGEAVIFETATPIDYNPKVDTSKIYMIVDQQPEFPGGSDAMASFINKNFKKPEKATDSEITRTIYVSFIVGRDGRLSEPKILRGINPAYDKEALRVVNAMPVWKPGKQSGQNVKVRFNIPMKPE